MKKIYVGHTYTYRGRPGRYFNPGDQVVTQAAAGVVRRVLVWPVGVAQPRDIAGIVCKTRDLEVINS